MKQLRRKRSLDNAAQSIQRAAKALKGVRKILRRPGLTVYQRPTVVSVLLSLLYAGEARRMNQKMIRLYDAFLLSNLKHAVCVNVEAGEGQPKTVEGTSADAENNAKRDCNEANYFLGLPGCK